MEVSISLLYKVTVAIAFSTNKRMIYANLSKYSVVNKVYEPISHNITYKWGLFYTQHYVQVGTFLHTALRTSGDYATHSITYKW